MNDDAPKWSEPTAAEADSYPVLNYVGEMHVRPVFHVYERKRDNLNLIARQVPISNARELAPPPSLGREGFCLVRHRSAVRDLKSRKAVARNYCREIEGLIRELTGAAKVITERLGVVRTQAASDCRPETHAPIRFVHADYSEDSALASIRTAFDCPGCEPPRSARCAVYNVWRVLTPAPQDVPLALCDLRTVERDDSVVADTILDFPGSRPGKVEASLFHFNPQHRWYYFPDMTTEEALVFTSFDSVAECGGRVPHSAFDNPRCAPACIPRVSLEIRVFALF